jgi:hypothetical protein
LTQKGFSLVFRFIKLESIFSWTKNREV